MQQGRLKLILWRDLAIPKKGTPYAHQVWIEGGSKFTHVIHPGVVQTHGVL